jgi:hypothetical protein
MDSPADYSTHSSTRPPVVDLLPKPRFATKGEWVKAEIRHVRTKPTPLYPVITKSRIASMGMTAPRC